MLSVSLLAEGEEKGPGGENPLPLLIWNPEDPASQRNFDDEAIRLFGTVTVNTNSKDFLEF